MVSPKLSSLPVALALAVGAGLTACSHSTSTAGAGTPSPATSKSTAAPSPDPRVGLRAGKMDAAEAVWNLGVLSKTPPPEEFVDKTNSDLAFIGHYAVQGNYNGYQVWDIANPRQPVLKDAYVCPA